ncbi:hypothetical protein KVV02_004451 [Mortierella alpina]|uniref:Chitinase n=1 Tax=Mortierella alpina TaxID=64518 RepID=A0A9P8A8L3_MORAP|nr:hypothetical protein KVV02_004451 [Mortierella alpina]
MHLSLTLSAIASALVLACSTQVEANVAAGYLLLNPTLGPSRLKALADNAANIPINRLFISFARPGMVYVPDSKTLKYVGLNYDNTSEDYGFADLKEKVKKLQDGGVEVFLSVGGWDYGCFPFLYTYYSVGGYGENTPNYYKIKKYGSIQGCTEQNQWCFTCEPEAQQTTLESFDIFPEPNSPTWKEATDYVRQHAGAERPVFHPEMVPGHHWIDPRTGYNVTIPGNDYFVTQSRDPYQDLVHLGKELGLAGVDIDYEEMWHGDYFKALKGTDVRGPFTNHQTVYKYAAIMRDVQINIQRIHPTLKLGTASAAVGALSTDWWGGNLKNVWYNFFKWYPEVYNFAAEGPNAGGVNVMTYDLSSNMQYTECPDGQASCPLNKQVSYYMKSYADAGMTAHVGYEIGIPAYPAQDHDPEHQLPLTKTEFPIILNELGSTGGFFWELYKPAENDNNVDAQYVAQEVCKKALGASVARCSGSIPQPIKSVPTWVDDLQQQLPFSLHRFQWRNKNRA